MPGCYRAASGPMLAIQRRERPDRAGERRHVVVAVPVRDEAGLELCGEGSDGQGHAALAGERQPDAEVLQVGVRP